LPSRNLKRKKPVYAESSSSEDDVPLASSPAKPLAKANGRPKKAVKKEESEPEFEADSEDEVKPKKKRAPATKAKAPPKKKVKEEDASDDEEIKPAKKVNGKKRVAKVEPESEDEDVKPSKKAVKPRTTKAKEPPGSDSDAPKPKKRASKVKEEPDATPAKGKGKKKKEEEEEEEIFRWWEQDAVGDGTVRWQTLEHNGVLFPPPYEPLPKSVKMKYNGMHTIPYYWGQVVDNVFREAPRPSARGGGGRRILWCDARD